MIVGTELRCFRQLESHGTGIWFFLARLVGGRVSERANHNYKPNKVILREEKGTKAVYGLEDRVLWLPPRGDINTKSDEVVAVLGSQSWWSQQSFSSDTASRPLECSEWNRSIFKCLGQKDSVTKNLPEERTLLKSCSDAQFHSRLG